MMAGPAHRSVSSIRPSVTSGQSSTTGAQGSPHTPLRAISSNFASPSTLRAEEDYVIIELGSRYMRAGFAGDALPKAVIAFGPEHHRRAGDYRKWRAGHEAEWRNRKEEKQWEDVYAFWSLDLKAVDLGLVGDKVERALRHIFNKYLLIDSRPRRIALILPAALPQPLLSTILDTIFNNYQPPTISLLSAPVLATVAAGLRTALIVDIGWAETVVTGIYEYREVICRRTVRASKLLCREMLKLLAKSVKSALNGQQDSSEDRDGKDYEKIVSFEECEEVSSRMGWCRPRRNVFSVHNPSETLPSVVEEDEVDASMHVLNLWNNFSKFTSIPLSSTQPPVTVRLPFSKLSDPCENALFADGIRAIDLDDEELPIHILVYNTLLHLPVDIRSMCMSRIILIGGGSNLPGLKDRVLNEVELLIRERSWDPVQGRAVANLQRNRNLLSTRSKKDNNGPVKVRSSDPVLDESHSKAAFLDQDLDLIGEKIKRGAGKGVRPTVQGIVRAVESMGAWAGASLLSQLKIPAIAIVEREQWLQSGAAGASRPSEASNVTQRQSMGPGGLRTGAGDRMSWTLGPWG